MRRNRHDGRILALQMPADIRGDLREWLRVARDPLCNSLNSTTGRLRSRQMSETSNAAAGRQKGASTGGPNRPVVRRPGEGVLLRQEHRGTSRSGAVGGLLRRRGCAETSLDHILTVPADTGQRSRAVLAMASRDFLPPKRRDRLKQRPPRLPQAWVASNRRVAQVNATRSAAPRSTVEMTQQPWAQGRSRRWHGFRVRRRCRAVRVTMTTARRHLGGARIVGGRMVSAGCSPGGRA